MGRNGNKDWTATDNYTAGRLDGGTSTPSQRGHPGGCLGNPLGPQAILVLLQSAPATRRELQDGRRTCHSVDGFARASVVDVNKDIAAAQQGPIERGGRYCPHQGGGGVSSCAKGDPGCERRLHCGRCCRSRAFLSWGRRERDAMV